MSEQDQSAPTNMEFLPETGQESPQSGSELPETPPEKIERRGRPKGSTNEYKGVLTQEQIARIRGRETKKKTVQERRKLADAERARRAVIKAEASAQAQLLPIPEPIRKPNPPEAKKAHFKDAIERCIVIARSVDGADKTRLEAMLERLYLLAMDAGTDIEDLLKVIQFLAERMEGKPQANNAPQEGPQGPPTLVVNIGTRFAAQGPPPIQIITPESQ